MKNAFTLLEMLVVLCIIAVLASASLMGVTKMRKTAERARASELVSQVKTALEALYDADGLWPKKIREKSAVADSVLDDEAAVVLATRGYLALSYENLGGGKYKLKGADRFGVLTPWGQDVMKRSGKSAGLSTKVNGTSTIQDHLLRFKVDLDGDGRILDAAVGGSTIGIRARVAVWCAGKDGKMETYRRGLKEDDIYSWTPGQTVDVN